MSNENGTPNAHSNIILISIPFPVR